jgi:fibro-slime domain-containing protein
MKINKKIGYSLLTVGAAMALTQGVQAASVNIPVTYRDFNSGEKLGGSVTVFEGPIGGHVTGLVGAGSAGAPVTGAVLDGGTWGATYGGSKASDLYTGTYATGTSTPGTTGSGMLPGVTYLEFRAPANSGIFSFSNTSFFPLDGQLGGNQGNPHNYHFSMELHNSFTYVPGQFFNFTGDDDVWVYVNGQLVIDLGGVHGAISGGVSLDALGTAALPGTAALVAGQAYSFDLFFNERHTTQSTFNAQTSIVFRQPPPVPEVSTAVSAAGFALLGGMFLLRSRKAAQA